MGPHALNASCDMTYDDFMAQWLDSSLFISAHTSGSTGSPKPVSLLKSDMMASARATNAFFEIGECAIFHCPLSLDYIAVKMMAVRAFMAAGKAFFETPSNNPHFIACDLLAIVPSQVDALINNKDIIPLIKNIIIGGAPLSDERRHKLVECKANAFETYGMTETCSHIALKKITSNDDAPFVALPGITFSLDSRGCLCAKLPHMSIKQVVTNDLAEIISSTSFRWLGRYDNIINSGGIKIIPEELEQQLRKYLEQSITFYITSAPDPKWGEKVVLVVETGENNINNIQQALDKIPSTHRPKEIICVKNIDHTSNGKIRRTKLL